MGKPPRFLTHAAFGAALLVPTLAFAQADLRLQDAVASAIAQSPQSRAAAAGLAAGDAGVDVARKRPNPALTVEAENFNGSGMYAGSRLRETTAMIELPLEIGGQRGARIRVATAEQAAAAADVALSGAEVVALTTEAFIRVVEADRRRTLAREQADVADQVLRAAQARVRAGKVSPLDAQRAEVESTRAQVDAAAAERRLVNVTQQLRQWTGGAAETAVAPWFDRLDVDAVDAGSGEGPLLARAAAEVSAAEARTLLAQRSRIPDITLSAGVRRFEETRDNAAVVLVSVPLPLFNTGAADVRLARAELNRAQAQRDAMRLGFERDLATARLDVEDARAAAQAASGPALAAATEAARIARIGYREGKFSQLDLLDAERSLNDTRSDAVDALAAFHLARNRLALLLGQRAPLYLD